MPAEAAARFEADSQIAELKRRERGEQKGNRLGLSILSPEIFGWRKGKLPALAVFAVEGDGECILSSDPSKEKIPNCCKAFYAGALGKPLASRVEAFFTDHFKTIWSLSALALEVCYFYGAQASVSPTWGKFALGLALGVLASFCASLMLWIVVIAGWTLLARQTETTAVARFAGAIPISVKQKIHRYRSEFKEMLVVAEANWTLTKTSQGLRIPACCDPLIVGWDGDYFWLIDRFNTSSLEQLACDEFAVKADDLDANVGLGWE